MAALRYELLSPGNDSLWRELKACDWAYISTMSENSGEPLPLLFTKFLSLCSWLLNVQGSPLIAQVFRFHNTSPVWGNKHIKGHKILNSYPKIIPNDSLNGEMEPSWYWSNTLTLWVIVTTYTQDLPYIPSQREYTETTLATIPVDK